MGACVPSVCTSEDLETIPIQQLILAFQLPSIYLIGNIKVNCSQATYDYPFMFYFTISLIGILFLLCLIGTILEILIAYSIGPLFLRQNKEFSVLNINLTNGDINKDDSSISLLNNNENEIKITKKETFFSLCSSSISKKSNFLIIQFFLCFSIPYNINRLFSTPPSGNLEPLNGIRVIAMMFVVLGHTFYFIWDTMPVINFLYLKVPMQTIRYQIVVAGFYAVDTFFWLSGFLVAYLFIKELNEFGIRRITFPMYYFHRIYRLTPTLLMGLLFFWFITPYWTNGPYWKYYQEFVIHSCNTNWYYTVLYIQNFVPFINTDGVCMGWTWYLADDFQFYIFSPIILVIYWKNKFAGWIITSILIVICIILNILIASSYDLYIFYGMKLISDPFNFTKSSSAGFHSFGKDVYLPPYTRMGPYLVGFLAAFILIEKKEKFYVSPFIRSLIYISSSLVILILSFIPYTDANYGWNEPMNVFYISFSRTMWGFALSGLLILSIVGYGGIFAEILSYHFWVPMARLSYGAYIYHLANIGMIYNGNLSTFTYQFSHILYYFLGHLLIAFGYSLLSFLVVEKPLMNIEAILLFGKRGRK